MKLEYGKTQEYVDSVRFIENRKDVVEELTQGIFCIINDYVWNGFLCNEDNTKDVYEFIFDELIYTSRVDLKSVNFFELYNAISSAAFGFSFIQSPEVETRRSLLKKYSKVLSSYAQ